MTDKELIKQEIERRLRLLRNGDADTEVMKRVEGVIKAYKSILDFVDSLPEEPASEELEEASIKYSCANPSEHIDGMFDQTDIEWAFEAGAKWQKQKDLEDSLKSDLTMPNKFYEKGRFDMREEMMKNAAEAFVNTYENTDDSNYVEFVTEQSPYKFKETEKCKIIIVKED